MNRPKRHHCNVLFAIILSVVLSGSILIKPIHIILVHHDLTEIICAHSEHKTVFIPFLSKCSICDFEFCSFITQKHNLVSQVNVIHELVFPIVPNFLLIESNHNQLRAPPLS